jgi:glycosyltransferase involved in cell wall biosynthesis
VRILYFSRDYTPHDHRFLTAMTEAGLQVFFLRLEQRSRQTEDRALPAGVELVRPDWDKKPAPFRWIDLPARVLELRRILRTIEPDVIHAGPIQTCAYIAALAGDRSGAPLVSMSWGSDLLVDAHKNSWMRNLTRFALRRSDWLLGDCRAVQDAAVEAFGFPAEHITLFPWGVDLQRFHPPSREGLPPSSPVGRVSLPASYPGDFVVLSLRSWEPIYGVDVVIKGFARAAAVEPRLRLMLLSGGSLALQIQRMIEQNGLRDRVHLGGQVSQTDLPRFYQAADLYLSASQSDGSSISLLEALASGLPALVSDIPGNREWVQPGEQGWLFPAGDPDALAQGLLRAAILSVDDPQIMARMRAASRRLAEERADWSKNAPKLIETYRKVLSRQVTA